jgi:hypothetical protein
MGCKWERLWVADGTNIQPSLHRRSGDFATPRRVPVATPHHHTRAPPMALSREWGGKASQGHHPFLLLDGPREEKG